MELEVAWGLKAPLLGMMVGSMSWPLSKLS